MLKTKYMFPQFAFYDRTGIQAYLEKQAEKGWVLEEIGSFAWKFARSNPRKLRFAVVYFPKADLYDPEPGEEEQTFREFCAHGGWTLAASAAQMQIFYSEAEDPTPIETDPVIEVENVHASMKKSMLPGYWMMLSLGILDLLMLWWSYSMDPLTFLSANLSLFMIPFWIVFLVLSVSQLARYYGWRRRARKAAAEDGIFVETKDNRIGQTAVCLLLMVVLVGILATMADRQKAIILTISMVMTLTTIAVVLYVRKKLKRDGYDAKTNRTVTLVAAVVVAIPVSMIGNSFSVQVMNNYPDREENLPLYIQDLLGGGEYDVLAIRNERSLFLEYYDTMQVPVTNLRTPRIQYEAVKVKVPALYDLCLEELLEVPDRYPGAKFETIDPAPWGAERAWQLREAEGLEQWYVLCYDEMIVEFMPDWDLTDEQKATVGEKFG